MYLFLDTLSPESYIALFDADRRIQASMQQPMKHKEFEQLPEVIEAILQKKGLGYADIGGIVVLHGPGSFTGTRVTCLIANTIAFAHTIPLYPLDYVTFLHISGSAAPYVIQANKREAKIYQGAGDTGSLVSISDIIPSKYSGTGDQELFEKYDVSLYTSHDYERAIRHVDLSSSVSQVHALYIKDPNITLPKKHGTRLG